MEGVRIVSDVKPTLRERKVFTALMKEFINQSPLAGTSVSQADLRNALYWLERRTLTLAKVEAEEQKELDDLLAREDFRA